MSQRLEELLREANIPVRIETRDRLAIVIPNGDWGGGVLERARVIDIARTAGFSHVAVEIDASNAPLSGD